MEEVIHYKRARKIVGALSWISIVLAIFSLIGIIVCLVMLGFRDEPETLLYILALSMFGGVLLFGGLGFLLYRAGEKLLKRERDALERYHSDDSFLVGDGTLATLHRDKIVIQRAGAPKKGDKPISIPLSKVRAFSLCSRRSAREKGEWSVVFEVPARDLAKDRSKVEEDEKFYIQTDAKPRLYESLTRNNIPLTGERQEDSTQKKKFTRVFRAVKPDSVKRKNALIVAAVGGVALVGGIVIAFLLSATVGSIVSVFGVYFGGRAAVKYFKSKSCFSVYHEGIFWQEQNAVNNLFLKWEEIEEITLKEENIPVIYVKCVCGAYHLPALDGVYDEMKRLHGEKCKAA